MGQKLLIVGAGNVGGFLAYHANEMGKYEVQGFLDDDPTKHGEVFCGLPVLGKVDYALNTDEKLAIVVAIANPMIKKMVVEKLKKNNLIYFPSFIYPTVWLGKKVTVDEGCIIYPGVSINYETKVEAFSTINMNSAIGHNCTLGKYTTLSPGVNLGGFTTLGNGSFVGIGASTLQGTIINEEVTIGGMSMVIKNVDSRATVVGNPAKVIKYK